MIPDKEWDLLGAHFGSEKESLKGLKMGQAQINVRTRACSGTFIARTKQVALTHNVRGKELKSIVAKLKILHLNFLYLLGNMLMIKFQERSSRNHVIHKVNFMVKTKVKRLMLQNIVQSEKE